MTNIVQEHRTSAPLLSFSLYSYAKANIPLKRIFLIQKSIRIVVVMILLLTMNMLSPW